MIFRMQTAEITRYMINGRALEALSDSEQFKISVGDETPIECRTTAARLRSVAGWKLMTVAGQHLPRSTPLQGDWVRFLHLVKEWHQQRGATSSPVAMAICPAYQKIIAMGRPAIKYILKQLELEGDEPDHWFWALEHLAGVDPVRPENRGYLKKMRADWLRWGLQNGESW